MKTLAEFVLDTLCQFTSGDQQGIDADTASRWVHPMWDALKSATPEEKTALVQAARERYEYLNSVDEHEFSPTGRISEEEFAAFEAMMAGPEFFDQM